MSSDSSPLLEVKNLRKYYENNQGLIGRLLGESRSVKAVDGVSFSIPPGETMGLVGESGCGKTTLGETIVRLHEPTSGSIHYKGSDLADLPSSAMRELRNDIQMVFQDPHSNLDPRMTIGEIVREPLDMLNIGTKDERRKRTKQLLDQVGLEPEHYNRYPHEFSGGQRQRIGIARAITVNPDFIVADEPVSALDVSVQAQVLELLDDLQDEFDLTYLFISHDLSVVRYTCDRVAVMYLGKIVELGPTEDIFEHPSHPYTRALLSAAPDPETDRKKERILLKGSPPSPENPPSGCRFHTRCPEKIGEVCEAELPDYYDAPGQGHQSACYLLDENYEGTGDPNHTNV